MLKTWRTIVVLGCLLCATLVSAAQSNSTLHGTLLVVWGDPIPPAPRSGGGTFFTLVLPNGQTRDLQMNGRAARGLQFNGKKVIISGHDAPPEMPPAANHSHAHFVVDTIDLDESPEKALAKTISPVGTKKVIFLLLRFTDDPAVNSVPHLPSFYTDLTNYDSPPPGANFPATINGFFKKASSNLLSWQADVGGAGGLGAPNGWLTLGHPKSYYANCVLGTCFRDSGKDIEVADEGLTLGRGQNINFSQYDQINFVFSNDLDCCAWGGSFHSNFYNQDFPATWAGPLAQDAAFYAHEMGHSLGLPHSGWVYDEYDSPWDSMSGVFNAYASVMKCDSYFSKNHSTQFQIDCHEPGGGYIAGYKDYLGWIPAANRVVVDSLASATVTIEANALPIGSLPKLIKVCLPGFACTGTSARFLTIEARVKGLGADSQYDNGIPGDGIIIHGFQIDRPPISGPCIVADPNHVIWAVPIDATPNDYTSPCPAGDPPQSGGLFNAQFSPGQTYTTSDKQTNITVVSRTGSTFVISVSRLNWLPAVLNLLLD